MIYCPDCGTANRGGSKYCNECGCRLEPPPHKCPACDALNPAGSEACAACGAGLLSAPGSAPEQAVLPGLEDAYTPTSPPPSAALPAWLQEISSPPEAGAPREAPVGGTDSSALRLAPAGRGSGEPYLGREREPGADTGSTEGPSLPPAEGAGGRDHSPIENVALFAVGADLLSGIQGTLPAQVLLDRPPGTAEGSSADGEDGSPDKEVWSAKAGLFAEIVAPSVSTALGSAAQPKASGLASVPRWLLYLLLAVAVVLPLLVSSEFLPLPRDSHLQETSFLGGRAVLPIAPVTDLHNAIESLDPGAVVLVAFDYDPSTAGEMDPVARILVHHLMERGARIVAMSLWPAGAATAQRVLDDAAADHAGYLDGYGTSFVNLGYIPGQAAGVRQLGPSLERAQPADFYGSRLATLPAMAGIQGIESSDFIVELAAAPDSLRWWIEQGSVPHGVSLGAAVSAAVEPMARPYYETDPRQVAGLVSGVAGAAMYQRLLEGSEQAGEGGSLAARGASPGDYSAGERSMAAALDTQLMGALVFVLAILAGNGAYLVRRVTRKER